MTTIVHDYYINNAKAIILGAQVTHQSIYYETMIRALQIFRGRGETFPIVFLAVAVSKFEMYLC